MGEKLQNLKPRGETLPGLSRCRVAKALRGFTRGNEKFHLSPAFVSGTAGLYRLQRTHLSSSQCAYHLTNQRTVYP
jgi:hypothetical protein